MVEILGNEEGKAFLTNGDKGIVAVRYPSVINSLNVTPTTSAQQITAPVGIDGYSPINVSAVTAEIDQNISSQNIKKDVTILGVTGSLNVGKYELLDEIYDDENNLVRKVAGFHTDANGNEYAVVFVGSQSSTRLFNTSPVSIPNMPLYATWATWEAKQSATYLTDLIISSGYPSEAVTFCRNYSFTIDGITYLGQISNYQEMINICRNYTALGITPINANYNTSNQRTNALFWAIHTYGNTGGQSPNTSNSIAAVIEIPHNASGNTLYYTLEQNPTSNSILFYRIGDIFYHNMITITSVNGISLISSEGVEFTRYVLADTVAHMIQH